MAIPRNVNGVNPAKVVKDGATMEDHQNIMLQSDDDDFELPDFEDDDALPDFDDAFDDDEKILQEKKASVDENVINLDDNELDKLLGIDEDFNELDGIAGSGETSDIGESSLYKEGAELSPEELDAVLANFDEMDFDETEEEEALPKSEELQEEQNLNSEGSSDNLDFDNDFTNDGEKFVELQEDEYDGDSYVVFDEPEEVEEENDDDLVIDNLSEDDFSALAHEDNDDDDDNLLLVIDEDEEDTPIDVTPHDNDDIITFDEVDEPDEKNDDLLVFDEDTDTDDEDDFDLVIVDEEDEDTDDEDEELDDKTFDDLVRQMNEALGEPEDSVDEEDDVSEDSEDFVFFVDDSDDEKSGADNILSDDLFVFEDDDAEDEDDEWSFSEIEDDEEESEEEDAFTPASTDGNVDEEEFSVPTLSKKPKDKKVGKTDEEPKDKNNKSKPEKKKTDGSSLLDKLMLLKEQIVADLKGEEVPKQLSKPAKEDEPDEEEDENEEETSPKKRGNGKGNKKRGKSGFSLLKLLKSISKSPLFKIFSPLKKFYLFLVKLCFGLLNAVLGILSSLPFVGKFVKPLQAASQLLQKIATYMPIVLVVLGLILFSYMSVPQKVSEDELPDGAALVIQKFKYNDGEPTAVIKNTGEVILSDVSVNFKVYSLQPELNPKTWVVPTLVQECVSKPVSVDIEGTSEVSVSCKIDEGYIPRVTGELVQ